MFFKEVHLFDTVKTVILSNIINIIWLHYFKVSFLQCNNIFKY